MDELSKTRVNKAGERMAAWWASDQKFTEEQWAEYQVILHFLILYDTKRQELIEALPLGTNATAAAVVYAEKEREHRDHDIEIVLIGADSLDTIKQTHPHYFDADTAGVRDFFDALVVE